MFVLHAYCLFVTSETCRYYVCYVYVMFVLPAYYLFVTSVTCLYYVCYGYVMFVIHAYYLLITSETWLYNVCYYCSILCVLCMLRLYHVCIMHVTSMVYVMFILRAICGRCYVCITCILCRSCISYPLTEPSDWVSRTLSHAPASVWLLFTFKLVIKRICYVICVALLTGSIRQPALVIDTFKAVWQCTMYTLRCICYELMSRWLATFCVTV